MLDASLEISQKRLLDLGTSLCPNWHKYYFVGQTNCHPEGSPPKRKSEKTTRVRTVLNEKQLHTLRTCYNANPRPDAMMKEQLVEMTGLSPRVIRVWFQNKRCKDKKKSMLIGKHDPASRQSSQSGGSPDQQVRFEKKNYLYFNSIPIKLCLSWPLCYEASSLDLTIYFMSLKLQPFNNKRQNF